jgi:hypothetical protein
MGGDWRSQRDCFWKVGRVVGYTTSHCWESYSGIEDYELKASITSTIRCSIWRRLHGMVSFSVVLKFHVGAVAFAGDFLGREVEEIVSPFNPLQFARLLIDNLHANGPLLVRPVRKFYSISPCEIRHFTNLSSRCGNMGL